MGGVYRRRARYAARTIRPELLFTLVDKTISVGIANENDAALEISGAERHPFGIATSNDTAGSVTYRKSVSLGIASENDAALAASAARGLTIGIASEQDATFSLLHRKSVSMGLAVSRETASPLYPVAWVQQSGDVGSWAAQSGDVGSWTDLSGDQVTWRELSVR